MERPAAGRPSRTPRPGLTLYGVLALEDPPREGVTEALIACRRAGIKVAMLTGDHPATAAAIASKVGLMGPDGMVLTGDSLPSDEAVLGALLDRDGVVVARVTPEDKLRIAKALHGRGHVIAMTGDGVNDAPALHEADIGIAMGRSGTDVAREAADLVLLDDHFASIVGGIEQGRATYINIRRFLTYHLTDNVAELTPFVVWALSGGRFPLALGVLQILALDLGTDTLSAVALGAEPPGQHVLDGPPVSGRLLERNGGPSCVRADRTRDRVDDNGCVRRLPRRLRMAAGRRVPDRPRARPSLGCGVHDGRARARGQRIRVPQLDTNAESARVDDEPVADPCQVDRARVHAGCAVRRSDRTAKLGHANPPLAGWAVAFASIPLVLTVDWLDKRASPADLGCVKRHGRLESFDPVVVDRNRSARSRWTARRWP